MIRRLIAWALLALAIASPAAAQIDPAARGLAVQARTLALGRDPKLVTTVADSRGAAVYIDGARLAFNMRSPIVWARDLTGQRFVIGPTFGVSGDRTDQMAARLPAAIATNAGILHLWGGVNDIAQNYPTASTSGATAAANIIAMAEAARAAGMKVIIEAEMGASTLTAAQMQQVLELRQRLFDYAENTPNVYVSDAMAAVMSPAAGTTTVSFKTGYSLDGTHETSLGAYWHAVSTLVPIFNTILPPRNVLIRSGTELPGNGRWQLLANPIFATATGGTLSGGGVSGAVPSGWTALIGGGATATYGTQADADGIGNNVTIACTWAAAGDACRLQQTAAIGDWQVGDIIQGVAQVQITGSPSCLAAARLNVTLNGTLSGTSTSFTLQDGYHATTAGSLGANTAYVATLMTRPFTVPAYTAKGYLAAYIYIEGSCAGSVNAVVRQVAIKRRVSALYG